MAMVERRVPTKEEVESWLRDRRNWGRWGPDDEMGTLNLITDEKRASAARLVQSGKTVSLSRFFPKTPGIGNPEPAHHWMRRAVREFGAGGCGDYVGVYYHGVASTHLDALCHVWDSEGMWNGRDPDREIKFDGASFGSIDRWSEGIITRGVLLDVPRHRGEAYVALDQPVHGWELEDIARAQGVTVGPGDAVVVYCGREAYNEANPDAPWGTREVARPGWHASCIPFLRDNDIAVIVWDMMDLFPHGYELPRTIHAVIHSYGLALVDNALLQPLAELCAREGRYEFMLTVAPLRVEGGTGSPVNPLVMF